MATAAPASDLLELVSVEDFLEDAGISVSTTPTTSLAERAKTVLQYDWMVATDQEQEDQRDLLALLKEHEVAIYRPEDVEVYKDRRKADALASHSRRLILARSLMIAGLFSLILGIALAAAPIINATSEELITAVLVPVYVLFCGFVYWMFLPENVTTIWNEHQVAEYGGAIPGAALELAVGLKEALPKLDFCVQELKVTKIARMFDPLLFVTQGSAKFCIAAWDEPGFDAQLLS